MHPFFLKGLGVVVDFENVLYNQFQRLDYRKFKVNLDKKHIFVCGGLIDAKMVIPPSFRHRFIAHLETHDENISRTIVLAESFKDYFKENTFNDLLVFEDEIANIASIVMIFLESPGSLVELGMFCSKPNYYKKLLIVAPQEHTEAEDSFIYLGPLVHIKRKEESSVSIYPWPDDTQQVYNKAYLDDLLELVKEKLHSAPKQVVFQPDNSGHIALLIYEVIRLSYPILIGEILMAMIALDIDIEESDVKRHIYILSKLGMIGHNFYSSYTYYYPLLKELKTINFGRDKDNKVCDSQSIQMSINQSYIMAETLQARKRKTAKTQINKKIEEASK